MSERPPRIEIVKKMPNARDLHGLEQYEAYRAENPESEIIQETVEQCAEKIAEFEALLARFEQRHNLEALRAITGFGSKEQRINSTHQPALNDLTPIVELIEHFRKQQPTFPKDAYEELRAKYRLLDRAVGTVRGDLSGQVFELVVHDR